MMSRSRSRLPRILLRATLGPITAAALSASSFSSQSMASALPANAPRFLADAAQTSVADFAYGLAEARISAGFLAFDNDFLEPGGTLWHRRPMDDAGQVPLETALNIFRTRYPMYDVKDRDGVLLIRARAFGVVRPLSEKRAERFRLEGVPLATAFNEAMRIVNPAIPVRGGVVGSVLATPDEPVPVTSDPLVYVDVTNATFVDVLNEIVKQAPGTVWILSRHGESPQAGYYTLAFRLPEGRITRFHDKLG